MIGKMASAFGLLMIFGVVSYGQSTWVLPDYSTSTLSLGIQQMGESMMLSNSIFNSQMALSSMSSGRKVNSGRRLSDKVKRGAGRGATRGSGAVRRGTTRFVSTAAPLMPARLAAELGRTPEERLQLERALSQMLAMSKRMMAEAGLAVDDVASGAQFAVLIGYRVRDEQEWSELVRRDDVQAAMVRAREVAAAELSGAEDERKQEEFERSVLMASVALGSYETGRRSGDERLVGQAKQLAAATLARWVR